MLRFSWARSVRCPFLLQFKIAAFKIGHLLLSLMLGAKTAAYYGQKTAANEVFSTSVHQEVVTPNNSSRSA